MPALLLLAAWISGTAALAAETVWFRALGRGVGTSAEALAIVAASFLGGLGLGAGLASRLARRTDAPLRAAAVCEAVAGVLVALSPLALSAVPDLHLALLDLFGFEPGPRAWPAALVAVPILGVPTAFLGATLPLLVRARVASLTTAGRWTGSLYGVNTLGAAGGIVAGLALLWFVGERATLALAGTGNLLAAFLLLVADRGRAHRGAAAVVVETEAGAPPLAGPHAAAPARGSAGPAIALFLTGLFALAAEVAWFRLLEPITGIHVFGFATLLLGVLVGTGLGAVVGGALADRVRRPDLVLAVLVVASGVVMTASVAVAGAIPSRAVVVASEATAALREAAAAAKTTAPSWDALLDAATDAMRRTRVVGALLTVAPPMFLFAAAYPLAVRARARTVPGAAGAAGALYAWNTLGNVVGSLVAGFLLLPAIGAPATLLMLGGAAVAAGAALFVAAPAPRPAWLAAVLALPLLPASTDRALAVVEGAAPALPEVVLLSRWSPSFPTTERALVPVLAESIAGTYPTPAGRPDDAPVLPREGTTSTVGVLLERGFVKLRQGGLAESVIRPDDPDTGTETEVALAAVPYLLHPSPKEALVIGHGAGWTVETLLSTPLARVDVAEIEPAVLDVVEDYRGRLAVRHDARARLAMTDGRLLLRRAAAAGGAYDLVVSQPSHPWVPGAGHLFTREAYALARAALRPGGVFAQWLNLFDMTAPLVRTALASWHEVFPHAWVLLYRDELLLVGCLTPPRIDLERWTRELTVEALSERTRPAGITGPADLLRRLVLDAQGLASFLGPSVVPSTDDAPRLELGLAASLFFSRRSATERKAIHDALWRAPPPDFASILPDARTRDAALAAAALRSAAVGSLEEARRLALEVRFDGGVEGALARARARLREARQRTDGEAVRQIRADALALLQTAVTLAPDDPDVAAERLTALVDVGDPATALREARALAARFPDHGPIRAQEARALMGAGDEGAALLAFRAAHAARSPRAPASTALDLARLLLVLEPPLVLEAREALREAVASHPTDRALLRKLRELEIDTAPGAAEDPPEVRRVEAQLRDADARFAATRLATARTQVDEHPVEPNLEAARDATLGLPSSAEAWRLRGWYELRAGRIDDAVASLSRSVRLDEDPPASRRRANDLLALFGFRSRRLDLDPP